MLINNFTLLIDNNGEGIDTLVFNLSLSSDTNYYPVCLHVASASKILNDAIPQNPGIDTVWNTAQKRYIALPRSNSRGDAYTYDITQDSLGKYAEIVGDYLHLLTRPDLETLKVAYTENRVVKHRQIALMPEPNPTPIAAVSYARGLNAAYVGGGLLINGLRGESELRAYNFKGVEIQMEKFNAKGSVFVKLRQNCPQVIQIKSANEKIYLKIAK
jgi:hypothetical protein